LYILLFGEEETLPERLLSEKWQSIGFQSKNPRTDFRGGGILSLLCLRYLIQVYPDTFRDLRAMDSNTFFLAISSINVTVSLFCDEL